MVIGHAAGTAAMLFARNQTSRNGGEVQFDSPHWAAIQDLDPDVLSSALRAELQILQPPGCEQ